MSAGLLSSSAAIAATVSPNEIVLGQTFDAGRAELALIARVQQAYFDNVNAAGGVRGRKIRLVSLDDGGDAARARQNLNELATRHQALAIFGMPAILASDSRVMPQLFVRDRVSVVSSDKGATGIVGFYPGYALEGALVARQILERAQRPRIAVLLGSAVSDEQFLAGLRKGLGADGSAPIAKTQSSAGDGEALDAAVRALQASDANVLVIAASPSITLRALAVAQDIGWTPRRIISSDSAQTLSAASTKPSGTAGVESIRYVMDGRDPSWTTRKPFQFAEWSRWDNDRGVQAYAYFMKHHMRGVDIKSEPVEYAYSTAQLMVQVLDQCRDRLTRETVSRQALRLAGFNLPLLSPGIRVYTHPGRAAPITQGQFMRFDGAQWSEFGEVIEADDE